MAMKIKELQQKIRNEISKLNKQLSALDDITSNPNNPMNTMMLEPVRLETARDCTDGYSIPARKIRKRRIAPRVYLKDKYNGMSVTRAALLAGARMDKKNFRASDIGEAIFDYRGASESKSRMHSIIHTALIKADCFQKVYPDVKYCGLYEYVDPKSIVVGHDLSGKEVRIKPSESLTSGYGVKYVPSVQYPIHDKKPMK